MNTIRRYAAEDAHVIYGTAYDETLGDQLRVTVIATGLSSAARRAESRTSAPLSVVQSAIAMPQLRTGTDNLPVLNQVAAAGGGRRAARAGFLVDDHAQRLTQRAHARRGPACWAGFSGTVLVR